jgi:hypothetical protein
MNMKANLIIVLLLLVTACSNNITPESAKKEGAVVSDYGVVGNIDKLDTFVSNFQVGESSEVNITRFTKEGDPIFINLTYHGEVINIIKDSSEDKFGGEDLSFTCDKVVKTQTEEGISYEVKECTSNRDEEILFIPANK